MRTTIRLPDDLLDAAKRAAAESGRTLTAVIEDALRQSLARRDPPARAKRVKLTTFKGTGALPGVDLDDGAAVRARMDDG